MIKWIYVNVAFILNSPPGGAVVTVVVVVVVGSEIKKTVICE